MHFALFEKHALSTRYYKEMLNWGLTVVEIQILEKTDEFMRFIVSGVNVPFVNALRRIMLTEVPTMAIDEIVILENSSIINDEILAHRMGFVPIKTDLDAYSLPEDCKCESEFGCNLCRANLTLEAVSYTHLTLPTTPYV